MAEGSTGRIVLWVIGIVALIWNGLGCMNLIQQMSPAGLASLPEEYQAFVAVRPSWALAGFAVSVVAGLVGAGLLLVRSRRASPLFALSCIGALISLLPTLGFGMPSIVIGSAMSAVLAAGFAVYARSVGRQSGAG